VTGTSITIDSSAVSANVVTIFVSGGIEGTTAEVKIKAETATRTLERTLFLTVENK
jgi:gamma-glutamyl phosphate reductase